MHPQSGKFQTACATVQGHLVHYAEVVCWRYKKGERYCSYLAIVTGSSTLPHLMKAVVHMDTNIGRTGFSQIEVTGQAPRKLVPCPLRKHWASPSW